MNIWESIILMVAGTVCIISCISIIYSSIVNTIERYNIRKTKRDMETFTRIIEQIPGVCIEISNIVKEAEEEKAKERIEKYKDCFKEE